MTEAAVLLRGGKHRERDSVTREGLRAVDVSEIKCTYRQRVGS